LGDALVGDTLERLRLTLAEQYAVIRELGRGGMAVVYLAEDTRHDRQVAIKVLLPELAVSLGGDRFLREIRVAARLQHPHILPLFDSGSRDGLLYYVMPFVEGESLRDKLTREKQLDIGEAVRLTAEVADALHYAHGQGIVHRDIKPENVMISGGHALVADFGIAKALSAAGAEQLTQTGMAIGTPHYMSPEQAIGENIDGRSDQYSLACVLYELLAGQPPFTGPTPMAVLARHSLERVPSLQIVRHSIPEAIEVAILRALEKVAADRYPNMGEFAEALRAAEIERISTRTGARPVPTRELPRSAAAESRVRRKRLILAGIGLAAVTALIGGIVWFRSRSEGGAAPVAGGPDPSRIAVLYFQSRGVSDSLQYLADGLTEALINELGKVKALHVISRNGVAPFRNAAVTPDSVARALKVGTLVTGTVSQSGGRLRVNVALVNAATGSELGSKMIERPRTEIFDLQDQLSREVAIFLRSRLGEQVQLEARRAETTNVAAWELSQQAEQLMNETPTLLSAGDTTAAARQLARADSLLGRASGLDPKWPGPLIGRARVEYQRRSLAGSFDRKYFDDWLKKGLDHTEQALRLKPDDPEGLELRGTFRYWQWVLNLAPNADSAAALLGAAERDLRRAVELNPSQAFSWALLSHLLMRNSETAEGKLAALRAYEADPYLTEAPVILFRLFTSSLDLQDGVEAGRWCQEGQERFPVDPRFVECQLWLMALPGQKPVIPRAWELLAENVKLYPPNQRDFRQRQGQIIIAMALARAGLADSARAVAQRSRADATIDPTRELVYLEAILRNQLGDRDEAIRLVSVYLATNPQDRGAMAKDQTWWWEGLRDDPRFKALVGSKA
jgi:TolB-like protein